MAATRRARKLTKRLSSGGGIRTSTSAVGGVSKMPARRKVAVEYEVDQEEERVRPKVEEALKTTKGKSFHPPDNWEEVWNTLKKFRYEKLYPTPVDTMGCDKLTERGCLPVNRRFHVLTSLLLSSQTKDPVTAAAMENLHLHANNLTGLEEGLTVDAVLKSSDQQINDCIAKVGFHRKKTTFLRQVAAICQSEYSGDIPDTIDALLKLPGIGPKMGYLCLQEAWGRVEGIGVDTHVHRISSRLKWVPRGTEAKGPEATRAALESWLPKSKWGEINHLLVGLGQVVCLPRNPQCNECDASAICPSSSAKLRKN